MMKRIYLFFLVAPFFFSSQSAMGKDKPQPTVYITSKGDKIVFLDNYYTSFLNDVKAGNKNMDSLYRDNISKPILNYFTNSEYSGLVKFGFYYSIQDTTGLENYIASIKSYEAKMEELITVALIEANKFLENDSITIYVQPSNNYLKNITKKMESITAVTAGRKQILLTVDPSVASWQEMIKYTIAHEFNHTYWTKMNFSNSTSFTLLNYLVFEGRADSYAHLIYPNIKCPWTAALNDSSKSVLWQEIKPNLKSEDQMLQRGVMFGSSEYPYWGGYTLGYSIVQSALKNHPELKPEQWAIMDPEKILEMSDYK